MKFLLSAIPGGALRAAWDLFWEGTFLAVETGRPDLRYGIFFLFLPNHPGPPIVALDRYTRRNYFYESQLLELSLPERQAK